MNHDFFHIRRKQFGKFWSTNKKMTLTFDLWPWNSIAFVRLSRYMFVQNIIKLSAAVHELSRPQAFWPYLAVVKYLKIRSSDLDLWSMTLTLCGFRAVAKIHIRAKLHQAECSGSWVIVPEGRKNSDENNTVRCHRAHSRNAETSR